jgi:hypothetical protein
LQQLLLWSLLGSLLLHVAYQPCLRTLSHSHSQKHTAHNTAAPDSVYGVALSLHTTIEKGSSSRPQGRYQAHGGNRWKTAPLNGCLC